MIRWMLHRQRSRRPRVEDLERVPQLQQRLRAYAAANAAPAPSPGAPDQQLQANYNQKMKELLAIEEDLRRQEAALMAREKKLKGKFASLRSTANCSNKLVSSTRAGSRLHAPGGRAEEARTNVSLSFK